MSATANSNRRAYAATPIQKTALVVGIVFLLVGVAGFIPGLTMDMGTMEFAGTGSEATLLGLFQVSVLHNFVHLLFGVVGVILARTASGARNYLIWGGIVYAVLWIYGLIFVGNATANFVPLNDADNWLHLFLAVGMIALGLLVGRRARSAARS